MSPVEKLSPTQIHKAVKPNISIQEMENCVDKKIPMGRLKNGVISSMDTRQRNSPDGTYWQMSYDDTERIITRIRKNSSDLDQMLSQETYAFDRHGNLISYTDQEGKTISREYDKLNRIKAEIAPPENPEAPQ